MAYSRSGGSARQQDAGYRYNAPKDDDKVKPEQMGRKAVKKDDQQNAPRRSTKKKNPVSDAERVKAYGNKDLRRPETQKLPEGLRHVGGAGSGPANFAGGAIPTPTPKPQVLPDTNAPIPTPSPGAPPAPYMYGVPPSNSMAGTETAPPAPSFTPPPNANMSQASILNTLPPELQAAPPGMGMAGQETAPRPSLPNPLQQLPGQMPAPGNSMAGMEGAPNPFAMSQDPKDILAQLLLSAGGGNGGAAPNQPRTGALGFPIPPNPFAGS